MGNAKNSCGDNACYKRRIVAEIKDGEPVEYWTA